MDKYADLHLHISLKHYVHKGLKNRENIWGRIVYNPQIHSPSRSKGDNYDQSDLSSLIEQNVKIAVIALHPVEKIIQAGWINRQIAKLFFGFKATRVKELYKNKSYFKILNEELELISKDKNGTFKNILVNNNNTALIVCQKNDLNDETSTKLVLSIEGGHALGGDNFPNDENEVLKNLELIKNNWPFPVFSLTLCHFEYNYLAGQSWAIPIPGIARSIGLPGFDDLTAKNQKITNLGWKVIEKCLDNSNGRQILIDIKHTHIVSRYEYYDYLEKNNLKIPIICSHTGVNGLKDIETSVLVTSRNKMEDRDIFQKFNPWEINLCDEEICKIYNSEGIIGISLDQRILGVGNNDFEKLAIDKLKSSYGDKRWNSFSEKQQFLLFHTAVFFENISHIVRTIRNEKAWDIICIGSDYDGIIDPIDVCPTVQSFPLLELTLKEENVNIYLGDGDFFVELYIKDLSDFHKKLRKVFYENLRDFLNRNITWDNQANQLSG